MANGYGKKKTYAPLSAREEEVGRLIVDAAYAVHKELGPGLLEKVYEAAFCYELSLRELSYKRQIELPVHYKGMILDDALRLDVLVEELVITELKAVDEVNPVWPAQILSHLDLLKKRLGYLINFNVPLIKQGIRRFVI